VSDGQDIQTPRTAPPLRTRKLSFLLGALFVLIMAGARVVAETAHRRLHADGLLAPWDR